MIKDSITKEYVKDNSRFADIVNYKVYNGKKVIKPENLQERDIVEIFSYPHVNKNGRDIQKYRDVLKICEIKQYNETIYALIAIENQSNVHYAMPVKNMLYDAINYDNQIKALEKRNKENKNISGAEFLSGMAKEDKIIPIITITVYWGSDEWDGPRLLSDMYKYKDEYILKYAGDYSINLVCPNEIPDEEMENFSTQLAQVFKAVKYSKSEADWTRLMNTDTEYKYLEMDTARLIATLTNINMEINEERGGIVNMCKAWEDHKKTGIREGIKEKGIKVFINCISRGIDEKTAQVIAEISDDLVLEAKKQMSIG